MSRINILSEETVNRIAAGEVVERPLSVVKELVENSIDAGANAVTVEIKDGGISFIRITDNGSGIEEDDIRTAFLPHATSKIRDADDLFAVSSLGFRGEALSSIAAVARCELITRTSDSISGVRYCIEGGSEVSFEEIGAPAGTTFIIRDLFFNTPARRKFLRSASAEGSYVADAVEKLAFAHPEISLRFISGGQTRLHTSGSGRLREVIYAVYGREVAGQLLEISAERDGMKLEGYVGKPSLSRGTRAYELFEVNHRCVKSDVMSRALEEAYQGFVMQHKYPVAVLDLSLPAAMVDVNVHPAKLEVRFESEETVSALIRDAVLAVLRGSELIVDDRLTPLQSSPEPERQRPPEPFETSRLTGPWSNEKEKTEEIIETEAIDKTENDSETCRTGKQDPFIAHPVSPQVFAESPDYYMPSGTPHQQDLEEYRILSTVSRPQFRLLGIYLDTYLLVEYKDDFLMIDQHAAHEKVLYERFMKDYEAHVNTSQMCDPPVILSLSQREFQLVTEHMEDFTAMGYEIEPFGGREMAVYAVPGNTVSVAREDLLIEIIDDLGEERLSGGSRIIREKIAMMSCKAAVKGGMHLSSAEAEKLLDELLSLDDPYNCPHGRPTAIRMSKYEIEKKFKRIV